MKNVVDDPPTKTDAMNFIIKFIEDHGYSPSMRDVQINLKLGSVSTARRLLSRMRSDGMIGYDDNLARSIRVYDC